MSSITFISAAWCVAALLVLHAVAWAADASIKTGAGKVEIVAHRGASYDAPENTLPAFKLAWHDGADAVELDLHLTSDGKLITIHDSNTLRVTGGEKGGGTSLVVAKQTAEALQRLDVGKWKDPKYAGEKLPLFEEVLATIPKDPGKRLFIESKIGAAAADPLVAALKAAGHAPRRTAVISFKLDLCRAVKEKFPPLKVYYLSDFKKHEQTGALTPTIDELIAAAKGANLDGLDLSQKAPLDPAAVKRIRDAGLELYVWTVDDPAVAQHFVDLGVDGITTNRPRWLAEQLRLLDR